MLASFNVPAACIARRADTMTTMPPLSSPAPGPIACSPLRTKVWKGLSASNTVSRWAMSNSLFAPFLPALVATRCPERPAFAISIHSTLKPSGSSSARIISPTIFTPEKFIVPEFWFTSFSSRVMDRSYSASTVATILASDGDNLACAMGERTTKARLLHSIKARNFMIHSRLRPGMMCRALSIEARALNRPILCRFFVRQNMFQNEMRDSQRGYQNESCPDDAHVSGNVALIQEHQYTQTQ